LTFAFGVATLIKLADQGGDLMENRRDIAGTRAAVAIVATILAVMHAPDVSAQSCSAQPITGSIFAADGSTPTASALTYAYFGPQQREAPGWGSVVFPDLSGIEGEWLFSAVAGDYLGNNEGPQYSGATCTRDPISGCYTCGGGFSIPRYAAHGNIKGFVTQLPAGSPGASWMIETYQDGPISPYTFTASDGSFDFARANNPSNPTRQANNWGVRVYGDGSGLGTKLYQVAPSGYFWQMKELIVTSSQASSASFCVVASGTEMPDIRNSPAQSGGSARSGPDAGDEACSAGPSSCGRPVSVVSGNMYFDQTDARIPDLGNLAFIRSYNSANRGLVGMFGQGWFSTYEQRIEALSSTLLRLRQGSGVVAYFSDTNADLQFDASFPFSRASWIVKQPNGSFVRSFRGGGAEAYDSSGRLTSITDSSGNVTTLTWAGSQLTTITSPSGRALTLAWGGWRPSTLSGPAGLIATYGYDAGGKLKTVTYADAAGSGYRFTYDGSFDAIAAVEDLSGRFIEKHLYDGAGRAYTSEIADGKEKYTFTYLANKTIVVDALNNTTTYDYATIGGRRRVTTITGPCESCGGAAESRSWAYEDWKTTATDADGKVVVNTYDPTTGDLLSVSETGETLTRTTTYTYDAVGRVQTVSAPDQGQVTYVPGSAGPTSITDAIGRATTVVYKPNGRVETITNPMLKVTTFGYDGATGDLTSVADPLSHATTFDYDAMGRRNEVTDAASNSTAYEYDVLGKLTKVTYPDNKFITFTYDKGGRRETVTDQLGRVTQYAYDAYGRLSSVTDAATPAGVTQYGYDAMSRLTTLTDAKGRATTFEYDAYGRVKKVIYPGGGAFETFTYFATGRLETRTDRKGVVTTYEYDTLGRLTRKSYSASTPEVTFAYDLADRLKTAANGSDSLTWTYDLAGQLLSEASTANASTVAYAYNGVGSRVTVHLSGQLFLTYAYDDAARLKSITRGSNVFEFDYDVADRRLAMSYPNGVATTYGYDSVSRLTSLVAQTSSTVITSFGYTYDDAGNRTTKVAPEFTETYTYDPLYRLKTVDRSSGTPAAWIYDYDAVGNRTVAQVDGVARTGVYNDRNELESLTGGGPTATYSYDSNGNLTQKVEGTTTWTYEWNAENQLTRVLSNGSEVARYKYDPLGRRVESVAGATTTLRAYEGDDILRESSGGQVVKYIHGDAVDEPIAKEDGAGVLTYFHADGLGSIARTSDAAGATGTSYFYDAFGAMSGGAAGYSFTGREWDVVAGLYYYRARYYDARIGRFTSQDPIGLRGGDNNVYAYVWNKPTDFIDPEGLAGKKRPKKSGKPKPPKPTPPTPPAPKPPSTNWGVSITCWLNTGYDFLGDCAYNKPQLPCEATCIPETGPSCHDYSGHGGCPPWVGYAIPYFVLPDGTKVCMPGGTHIELGPVPCACGDISNTLPPWK
jgi:RHS repeat-associated protein